MSRLVYILIFTLFISSFSFAQIDGNSVNYKYIYKMNSGKYVARNDFEKSAGPVYYDFLNNGDTKEHAKTVIAYALKEMQNQFKVNAEGIYDVFKLGYVYDETKKTQLSCSDKYIQGNLAYEMAPEEYDKLGDTKYFAWRNRAMAKARDILGVESSAEDKFYRALSFYVEDGLGSILEQYIEFSAVNDELSESDDIRVFLDNYNVCESSAYCDGLKKLYYYILQHKDGEARLETIQFLLENNLYKYALFQNGYFDIYNDGFYEMVQVSKIYEFSILSILENSQLQSSYDFLYARYLKLYDDDIETYKSSEYNPLHCTNNVYNGHLYIFPYNGQVYLVNTTETENKLLKIEMRAPSFMNKNYGKNYSTITAFQDIDKNERSKIMSLHKVSNMGTFSYSNNILNSWEYIREPQSPMGDVDKVKERRGQKIMPSQLASVLNNKKFSKKTEKEVLDYVEYLQEFTSKKLIADSLYFYVVNTNKDKVVLAASTYYNDFNEQEEILFIVNNKNLKIINKDVAAQIDNVLSGGKYYKTLVSNNGDTVFIGFIQSDNNIFVVNVVDNKAGSSMFPIYYYQKTYYESNDDLLYEKLYPKLQEAAGVDCMITDDYTSEAVLCSYRPLLTVKAYLEKLYKSKMEKAEQKYYPENIKESYKQIHEDMQFMYNKCPNNNNNFDSIDCMLDIFLSYEDIFSR